MTHNPMSDKVRNPQEKQPDPNLVQRRALAAVAQTSAGITFLKSLMATCGYQRTSVDVNEHNEVLVNNIIYNEAKRDLWLRIRGLLPRDALIAIEIPKVEDDHNDRRDDTDDDGIDTTDGIDAAND